MSRRHIAPPGADHSNHDRLLIARYAARDVDAAEAGTAETMVAECTDCAVLIADLVTITRTVAAVSTPRRTRDFRISAEQAAAVRGSFLERILRRFAMPSTAVLQPLAGAAVAIGLVLVVVGGTLPGMSRAPMAPAPAGYSAGSEPSGGPATQADAAASEGDPAPTCCVDGSESAPGAPEAAPSERPDAALTDEGSAPLGPGSAPTTVPERATATDERETSARATASAETTGPIRAPSSGQATPTRSQSSVGAPDEGTTPGDTAQVAGQSDPAGPSLIVTGSLLAAAGVLLLLLRVVGQRMTRDPGIR